MNPSEASACLAQARQELQADRPEQALHLVETALAHEPREFGAHELAGWILANHPDRFVEAPARALAHLQKARSSGGWDAAIPGLGLELEAVGRDEDAYYEFGHVLTHDGVPAWARQIAFLRRAALLVRRGKLRAALTTYRQADVMPEADVPTKQGVAELARTLERTLLDSGRYFPHAAEELGWIQARDEQRFRERTPTLTAVAVQVAELRRALAPGTEQATLSPVLDRMMQVLEAGVLGAALANRCFCVDERPLSPASLHRSEALLALLAEAKKA
ncbi:MAG: hypothetical protein JW940_28665 [Polyangiaceae bacterium]|nr:hypothetical protein [Polyangiaceae bacterium]